MIIFILLLLLAVATLFLALYGLAQILSKWTDPDRGAPPPILRPGPPSLIWSDKILIARRQVDELLRKGLIDADTHFRLAKAFNRELNAGGKPVIGLPDHPLAAAPQRKPAAPSRPPQATPRSDSPPAQGIVYRPGPIVSERGVAPTAPIKGSSPTAPRGKTARPNPPATSPAPPASPPAEMMVPRSPGHSPTRTASRREAEAKVGQTRKATRPSPSVAPWEADEPAAPATRSISFREMMARFMLEKNIRWGELASGILIVGSALGLVISLREQLQDTIPYFSAILFFAITAAVIGAGIYTLKKWKLRTTSRGTLVIGLLLIPLSLLAACLLSEREMEVLATDDPRYWLAILIGLPAYTGLSWVAGKYLLRKGQWPIVWAVGMTAIGTLLINRMGTPQSSLAVLLALTLPLIIGFVGGTWGILPTKQRDRIWAPRRLRRLWIALGIATFAVALAAALLFVRVDDSLRVMSALLPLLTVIGLTGTALGRRLNRPASSLRLEKYRPIAMAMEGTGIVVVAIATLLSLSHPLVLLLTATVGGLGLGIIAVRQQAPPLLAGAWWSATILLLALVNLAAGNLLIDQYTSWSQLQGALFNGLSGLAGMTMGALALIGAAKQERLFPRGESFRKIGWITGGGLLLGSSILALIASFLHPADRFDNAVATGLLTVVAVAASGAAVFAARWIPRIGRDPSDTQIQLAGVTIGAWLAAILHALAWNRDLSAWRLALSLPTPTLILCVGILVAVALTGTVWLATRSGLAQSGSARSVSAQSVSLLLGLLAGGAVAAGVIGLAGGIPLWGNATGRLTVASLIFSGSFLVLLTSLPRAGFPPRNWMAGWVASTAIPVGLATTQWLQAQPDGPAITEPRFGLFVGIALLLWSTIWLVTGLFRPAPVATGNYWRKPYRVEWVAIHLLSITLVAAMAFFLAVAAGYELFAGFESKFLLPETDRWLVGVALLIAALGLLLSYFALPDEGTGALLVVSWLMGWGWGAIWFAESHSTASALRWLIPLGGLVLAVLSALRWRVLGSPEGPSALLGKRIRRRLRTLDLGNLVLVSLGSVTLVVLAISSTALARIVMRGGTSALGGPLADSWFAACSPEVSYAIPVGLLVAACLVHAISERRVSLALAGSCIFQYFVLFATILVLLAPDPRIASQWFANILLAVSLAMSLYGFVWLAFQERIHRKDSTGQPSSFGVRSLAAHVLGNGFLITVMAILVYGRFVIQPAQPGNWVSTLGSPLGLLAVTGFACLAWWLTLRHGLVRGPVALRMSIGGWLGLVLVAMVTVALDRWSFAAGTFVPWRSLNCLIGGTAVVATGLGAATLALSRFRGRETAAEGIRWGAVQWTEWLPMLVAVGLSAILLVRAIWGLPVHAERYLVIGTLLPLLCLAVGCVIRSSGCQLASSLLVVGGVFLWTQVDPANRFANNLFPALHLSLTGLALIGVVTVVTYVGQAKRGQTRRWQLVGIANGILPAGAAWLFLCSLMEWWRLTDGATGEAILITLPGAAALIATAALCLVQLSNPDRVWVVGSTGLVTASAVILFLVALIPAGPFLTPAILAGLSGLVAVVGFAWRTRDSWVNGLAKWGLANPEGLKLELRRVLPRFAVATTLPLVAAVFACLLTMDERPARYLAAMSLFGTFAGTVGLATASPKADLRRLAAVLLMLFGVAIAWADLAMAGGGLPYLQLIARALLVFALATVVAGWWVPRWVESTDAWLPVLKETSLMTTLIGGLLLGLLTVAAWQKATGEGVADLPWPFTVAITLAGLAMVTSLVRIAVLPKHDPFSLSLDYRTGYVYGAQAILGFTLAYLFLAEPWLFRLGLKDYWPYLAMAVCFAGVGIAQLTGRRNLEVLQRPLFNTAAIAPLLVAGLTWWAAPAADPTAVFLIVGGLYLWIAMDRQSALSGFLSILFGNAAFWLLWQRIEGLDFATHPSLWLIPPALCLLVVSQAYRNQLTAPQRTTLRYFCTAVIYISATSEIFMDGLGTRLWPPILMAILALCGIAAGILVHVRGYIYFGLLFLLLAMIAMVSHAQQQLGHVWPWWAFGIGSGLAILVLFGIAEKQRNQWRKWSSQFLQWDP